MKTMVNKTGIAQVAQFFVGEMGILILLPKPNKIYLFESFLLESLKVNKFDRVAPGIPVNVRKERRATNIACPFCKKGVLFIKKIEVICAFRERKKRPIGNFYVYVCSSALEGCDASFFGGYVWEALRDGEKVTTNASWQYYLAGCTNKF